MRYVLLVNIGPVQGFIATARRTRDLWYGSWLLSELSKCAAATVMAKGGDLIFPAVNRSNAADLTPGSKLSVVNRVVALIDAEPEAVMETVLENLHRMLSEQWEDARQEFRGPLEDEAHARAQILDLVECVWAAVPCAQDGDYAAAREQAELLLAARKNTRNFEPVSWGGPRPKSSLDGQREAVIPEDRYPADNDEDQERERKIALLYREYGAGRAERLSAVDLLKRHGSKEQAEKVRSTSHIAARSFLDHLQRQGTPAQEAVEELAKTLKDRAGLRLPVPYPKDDGLLGYDGYLLYENRLSDEAKDQGRSKEESEIAVRALAAFYERIEAGRRPSPYYALVVGDGDNMGKVIDGQPTIAGHRAISSDLSQFADGAKAIVEARGGYPIYTGGDDVMAFVPLHTLLACVEELHAAFAQAVGSYRSKPDAKGAVVAPSLSIGVVIAHHIEPLSDALHLAREAEKAAKRHPGKDALAITLSKRSGADRTSVGGWSQGIAGRLRWLMDNVVDEIPEGAAYELLHMQQRLTPVHASAAEQAITAALPEVIAIEARRILSRKRSGRGTQEMAGETVKQLTGFLQVIPVEELASELIVANLLASAERLALGAGFGEAKAQRKEVGV